MKDIKIRECTPEDYPQIIKLIDAVLIEFAGRPLKNRDDVGNYRDHYRERDGIFYVVEQDGKIVGTAAVRRETEDSARLRRHYIYPEYRGEGIGKRLLEKRLEFCKEKGYKKVIACTYLNLKTAIHLLNKYGFKEYKREGETVYFEKSLI